MTDAPAGEPRPQPLIDFRRVGLNLWHRRGLVVGMTVAFVVCAGLYLAATRPTFTATAVVLVDPNRPQTTDSDNVLPGIGSDSAAIASQLAVIASRELLSSVFDRGGFADDPEFSDPGFIGGLLGSRPGREAAFETFAQHLSVEREGLTYIINVGFRSADPDKAARIVNDIVEGYIAGQVSRKAGANAEVSALLGERIAELEDDVAEAERAVEAFRASHGIYTAGAGSTQLQAQIDQLELQLASARETAREAETAAAQAKAAGMSAQALVNLSDVLASPTADALRAEYNQRMLELSSAQSVLGPRHPTLRRLQTEVERVEALMVREAGRITAELDSARDIADGVVARIEADLAALRAKANDASLLGVELRQLERNADASREVLEQFKKRSTETSQFEALQFSDARVITAATAPLRPTWPRPALVLAVAAALGLLAGSWLALSLAPRSRSQAARPVAASVWTRLRLPLSAAVTARAAKSRARAASRVANGPDRAVARAAVRSAPPSNASNGTVTAPATSRELPVARAGSPAVAAAREELRRKRRYADLN